MVRSCGIHLDHEHYHVVCLEGTAKKHRVSARASGRIPAGEGSRAALTEALRDFVREQKSRPEAVGLAVDSGLAAFRSLTVPFDDRAKIEEIIKFEVESDLPQWSIEDVIVDFLVVDSKPGVESKLLVTALPKAELAEQLAVCEKAGVDPQDAELDGTALFEAARAAGFLDPEAGKVLVHVGDATTTVVVADGERLASIRAIRAGALPPAHGNARTPEGAPEGEEQSAPEEDEAARARGLERSAKRISRELARTISAGGVEHEITAVHICGARMPGLSDQAEVAGVPLVPLSLESPDVGFAAGEEDFAIAYGAALRALGGGVLAPMLRREELHYSGKFERLELPLAVFALLLCTFLGVKLIITQKQIDWRDRGNIEAGMPGDMQVWLQYTGMYLLPDPEHGVPGRLKDPPKKIADYIRAAERGEDPNRTTFQELLFIRGQLQQELKRLKTELGHISDVKQPQSALQATTLALGTLHDLGDAVGRFAIRSLDAEFQQGSNTRKSPDKVLIRLDMDFFAENDVLADQHHAAYMHAMRAQPWCLSYEERPSKPFPSGGGLSFDGIRIEIDVAKALEDMDAEGGA